MSTTVRTLTPIVEAAPGEVVVAEVEIHTPEPTDASYVVTIVGLEAKYAATDDLMPPAAVSCGSKITMTTAMVGVAREYRKLGRLVEEQDFGPHFDDVSE